MHRKQTATGFRRVLSSITNSKPGGLCLLAAAVAWTPTGLCWCRRKDYLTATPPTTHPSTPPFPHLHHMPAEHHCPQLQCTHIQKATPERQQGQIHSEAANMLMKLFLLAVKLVTSGQTEGQRQINSSVWQGQNLAPLHTSTLQLCIYTGYPYHKSPSWDTLNDTAIFLYVRGVFQCLIRLIRRISASSVSLVHYSSLSQDTN